MRRTESISGFLDLLAAVSLCCLVWALGCEVDWEDRDTDSLVGADLLRREPGGIVDLGSIPADSCVSYSPDRGDLGFLLVGNRGTWMARTVITFAGLPDTLDLDDARLVLTLQAYDWEEPFQQIQLAIDQCMAFVPIEITLADTMAMGHRVTQSICGAAGNSQLTLGLFSPSEGTGSCAFASSELGDGPTLELEYTEDDSVHVLYFEATEDTYFLDGEPQVNGLLISQAKPARVRAYFRARALRVSGDTSVVAATLKLDNLSIGAGTGLTLIAYPDDGTSGEVGRAEVSASDSVFSIALSEGWVLKARSWGELPPDSSRFVVVEAGGEGRAMGWLDVGRPLLAAVYSVSPTLY